MPACWSFLIVSPTRAVIAHGWLCLTLALLMARPTLRARDVAQYNAGLPRRRRSIILGKKRFRWHPYCGNQHVVADASVSRFDARARPVKEPCFLQSSDRRQFNFVRCRRHLMRCAFREWPLPNEASFTRFKSLAFHQDRYLSTSLPLSASSSCGCLFSSGEYFSRPRWWSWGADWYGLFQHVLRGLPGTRVQAGRRWERRGREVKEQ